MVAEIDDAINYRNVNYETDIRHAVIIAKILLAPIGIWPGSVSYLNRVHLFLRTGFISFLMFFLLIPHVIYTFYDCENLIKYMKVIAAQIFSFMAIIKFWTMIVNRNEIRLCLTHLELQYRDVKCEEDRSLMIKCAKIGRIFTTLYLSLSYGGALPYHIVLPLVSDKVVKSDNTTHLPLPYLSDYVFFVIEDSPIYEITFVTQMLISFVILSTNCGIYSFMAIIMIHSCGLFEIVNRRIEEFSVPNRHALRNWFSDVVQHHLKAIEYASLIEKALSIVFLSEIVGCTLVICFLEFGVIMEWEDRKTLSTMTYFILMTSIYANMFIISFIGDRLTQESERVGQLVYFTPWYDIPEDMARSMRTIILRTSHPTILTGGRLFNLSLQAFCGVFKTSAAYFNFLRAMTK